MKRSNGCGSISKIAGRSKPYRVLSPAKYSGDCVNSDGNVKTQRVLIGYYRTLKEAEIALAKFCDNPFNITDRATFGDLFSIWIEKKSQMGKSTQTIASYQAAFKRCGRIADTVIYKIRLRDLVRVFEENADAGKSTVNNIKIVIDGVFEYAERYEYINKNYARLINSDDMQYSKPVEDKHRIFTADEIGRILTADRDIIIDVTRVLLYTGFRVNELLEMTADNMNPLEMYLQGGKKTAAGKNRIVPIHEEIQSIMMEYYEKANGGKLFEITAPGYRKELKQLSGHLPHDTRHTFITQMQNLQVDRVSIERLVGHTSKSITDSVYTHKDVEELRKAIQKLTYIDTAQSGERKKA